MSLRLYVQDQLSEAALDGTVRLDAINEIINKVLDAAIEAAMKNKSTENERMWNEKYDYRRGYLQAINDSVGDIKALKERK